MADEHCIDAPEPGKLGQSARCRFLAEIEKETPSLDLDQKACRRLFTIWFCNRSRISFERPALPARVFHVRRRSRFVTTGITSRSRWRHIKEYSVPWLTGLEGSVAEGKNHPYAFGLIDSMSSAAILGTGIVCGLPFFVFDQPAHVFGRYAATSEYLFPPIAGIVGCAPRNQTKPACSTGFCLSEKCEPPKPRLRKFLRS